MEYSVIIPAAGSGQRVGLGFNKLIYTLNGKTIIEKSVSVFLSDQRCMTIILVVSSLDLEQMKGLFHGQSKIQFVIGGQERQMSVFEGLKRVTTEIVFVHDGARPHLKASFIDQLLITMKHSKACLLMVPVTDTIKVVDQMKVVKTLDRNQLMQAQTPQAFNTKMLLEAHQQAVFDDLHVSDDAALIEHYQLSPIDVVLGDYQNIKITTKDDLKK